MCWSCGRIANAATGTSTRHPRTCLSARTSAPGAATARRMSCTGSVRTAAASSSGAPSARPACSKSTPHRPSELSGQDALRHPPADPPIGEQERHAQPPRGEVVSIDQRVLARGGQLRVLRLVVRPVRFRWAARSCRRMTAAGCRAAGSRRSLCPGRSGSSSFPCRRVPWVRDRCRSSRPGWFGPCRTGCLGPAGLAGLEHGAGLVVIQHH